MSMGRRGEPEEAYGFILNRVFRRLVSRSCNLLVSVSHSDQFLAIKVFRAPEFAEREVFEKLYEHVMTQLHV